MTDVLNMLRDHIDGDPLAIMSIDHTQRVIDEIERLRAELAAERELRSKYQSLAAQLSDKLHGTPCAEIRWQQERDALRELLDEAAYALRNPNSVGPHKVLSRIAALGGGNE